MNTTQTRLLALAVASLLAGPSQLPVSAQTASSKAAALQSNLDQIKESLNNLPAPVKRALSTAALNLIQLSDHWDALVQETSQPQIPQRPSGALHAARDTSMVLVSNPATDFQSSIVAGFTQSETSTAWCGSSVVVGFNDTGSIFETTLAGPGGASSTGVSFSRDSGATFQDGGAVNPPSTPGAALLGDPVVACTSPSDFYFSQSLVSISSVGIPQVGVGFSTSNDGGSTWGEPVAAVTKNAATDFVDKEWMTVDPNNPQTFYVTYTDYDTSGLVCPHPDTRAAIEIVRSTDGGRTWGSPVSVTHMCLEGDGFFATGSQVAVAPDGAVYVLWERFSTTSPARELDIAKSVTQGASFGKAVKVSDVTYVGDGNKLQNGIRIQEFPSLAIDRSATTSKGTLYITWNDGRNKQRPDAASASGFYGYGGHITHAFNEWRGNLVSSDASQHQFSGTSHRPVPAGRCSGQYRSCGRLLV